MSDAGAVLIFTSALILFTWLRIQRKTTDQKQLAKAIMIAIAWPMLLIGLGNSGALADFSQSPPPFMPFMISLIFVSIYLTFSKYGTQIIKEVSLANLVLFQSFRILAELAIVLGVHEGIVPSQMSMEGYNFDIITGISALVLGLYLRKRENRKLVYCFNIVGLLLLAVVMFIAMTSMPTSIRLFMTEPSNVWVTHSPFILLPGILVVAALSTHLLIFRKLSCD